MAESLRRVISSDAPYMLRKKQGILDTPMSSPNLRSLVSNFSEYLDMTLKDIYLLGIFTSVNSQLKIENVDTQLRKILLNRPITYHRNNKVVKYFTIQLGRIRHRFGIWNTLRILESMEELESITSHNSY